MHTHSIVRSALLASLIGLSIGFSPLLHAHEFWFAPIASPQALGATAVLRLEVGELFTGEVVGFSMAATHSLRHFAPKTQRDLRPVLPAHSPVGEISLILDVPGTHLLAFDSEPQHLTLGAEKFHAYLKDEGLDFIRSLREQAGTDAQPGRERYRRNIKTLLKVGPASNADGSVDTTYATQVGQRLEILPLRNPLTQAPGATLPLRIVFDHQPLQGALVKAWHKHNGQLLIIRSTTSALGQVEFQLPYAGDWMVSVVHMIPVTDTQGVDWESAWASLTFHIATRVNIYAIFPPVNH